MAFPKKTLVTFIFISRCDEDYPRGKNTTIWKTFGRVCCFEIFYTFKAFKVVKFYLPKLRHTAFCLGEGEIPYAHNYPTCEDLKRSAMQK